MARTGRFGRLPRAQPSLTSILVSLAREFQAARDRNIMDAWKNGGEFEGAPATDERVLAHWRGRLQDISPKDPLHDQYSNTVLQFEYAVDESKNSLLYAQGKINDQQRAQFFLDWAKRVDPNTEFYRTLQRNAAQFLERVKAVARSSGTRARAAASGRADNATTSQYEAVGSYLTAVLTQFARDQQLIGQNDDLANLNFYTNDGPARMIELINALNGSPVLLEQLKQIDPNFSGTVTYDYYQQSLRNQTTGLDIRYRRAVADGRKEDANALKKQRDAVIQSAGKAAIWDSATTYLEMRKAFLVVWEDGTASPTEKLRAWETYRNGLMRLANDPDNPVDPATKTTLEAEANLNSSIDSWWENFTRATSIGTAKEGGDIDQTGRSVATLIQEYAAVNDGTGAAVWTYGERNDAGVFVPKVGGTVIGATSAVLAQQAGARAVLVPQGDGSSSTVYVAPSKVTAVARDQFGNVLQPINSNPTLAGASILDVWVGGQLVRVYGYRAGDGSTRYTTVSPWGGGVREYQNADGSITVDVSEAVQAGKGVIAAENSRGETVPAFDPIKAAADTVRSAAGINQNTDFLSPMLAVLQATPDGRAQLAAMTENSTLRRELERDGLAAMTNPDGKLNVESWNRFTQQLDLQATLTRPEDDPAGYGFGFDSTVSAIEGVAPTGAGKPMSMTNEEWATSQGQFVPLAQTMSQPGQLGTRPEATPERPFVTPTIRLGEQLVVPVSPFGGGLVPPPPPPTVIEAPAPFVPPLPQNVSPSYIEPSNMPSPYETPSSPLPEPPPPPSITPPGYQPTFEELAAGWTPS